MAVGPKPETSEGIRAYSWEMEGDGGSSNGQMDKMDGNDYSRREGDGIRSSGFTDTDT